MGTYFTILTCRNSENTIEDALNSLKSQTVRSEYVIVIDDGSTDRTPEILKKMQADWDGLKVITNQDLGYDIGRVVNNWNKALKLAEESHMRKTDYHMISADDVIFEKDYAKKIISKMDVDPKLAIVSGNYMDEILKTPLGGGRFVRNSFFMPKYRLYPEKMGYESAILYMALQDGFKYSVLSEARLTHTRELGANHRFYEFGAGMRSMGFHPLFALGRFLIYFTSGKPIGRRGAINMLYYYLTFRPKKEGYCSMHDKEIRDFIRSTQCIRIRRFLKKIH